MSAGVPDGHPLYSIPKDRDKPTVDAFRAIERSMDEPGAEDLKATWREIDKYSRLNLRLLKKGYRPPLSGEEKGLFGPEGKQIYTDDFQYNANMRVYVYDRFAMLTQHVPGYFGIDTPLSQREAFKKYSEEVLEREKLRYELVETIRANPKFKQMTEEQQDKMIADELAKTYEIKDDKLVYTITGFGDSAAIRWQIEKQRKRNEMDAAMLRGSENPAPEMEYGRLPVPSLPLATAKRDTSPSYSSKA